MKLSVPVDHGVTLNVRHRPGGDGRPFLLLHGLGSNARMWDEAADRLAAAGHPVYALDMRGHGESDVAPDGYDNETVVADLVTVCRELGLTGALLAGHSWGGNIAVRTAAEHPELAAGLALVDGGWLSLVDSAITIEKSVETLERWHSQVTGATEETIRELQWTLHPTWSEAAIEAIMADLVKGPDGRLAQRLPLEHQVSISYSMWNDPPARWYPGITVPVLLLIALPPYSALRGSWARKWVAEAQAAIPQADSRSYVDADHNLHADQPERVANDLLDLAHTVDKPAPERS
ncbi:alpha/beta hydrolase [Streptomyces sp. NBS 14/10]|uniref:alpha/beta fold hydrolase n=1 Tax=Streptomyces sp. NBS 14/10 TaxID=1945643 RepID=UPI000B801CB9|nr:alpha/beta hydrolase [Streptomyces sp. NBS 14/10]KAK1178078.1 alpha/beta hydrolase [Streptomyces sp. NBS 14/10]NUP36652.1 alpha/beta hydrolase [Streptomyces sp.]NUS88040.1 alpha/beta hydrolase [Streptomyces sp.]